MKQQYKSGFGIKVCCLLLAAQALTIISRADNVNWGPFHMTVGVQAGVEFDDNAKLSEHNPETSFALTLGPNISGSADLPVTLPGGEQARLNLALNYTYKVALWGPTTSTFNAPITVSLVLPMHIEEWTVVVGDSFTFSNEPLESTYGVNRSTTKQYNNNVYASATRQLGRFALTLAGSRQDQITPDDPSLEQTQYQLSVTPAFYLRENYSIFIRNTFGLVYPEQDTEQNTQGWSSEVGVSGVITPYLNGSISVGYAHSHLEQKTIRVNQGGIFGGIFDTETIPADNVDGITSTIQLNYSHPFRPNTTYSISAFRSPGVTAVLENSDITEVYGANLNIQHRVNSYLTLSPSIQWTHLEDVGPKAQPGLVGGSSGEIADILAIQMGLTRVITQKLTANFNYRYQFRNSNLKDSSYQDNFVTFYFNYNF
jgi:hypothetical protein